MIPTTNNEYKPYKPEEQITVTIFKREAILVSKLRKVVFGKVMVHKMDGKIVRIEPTGSEIIDENQDVEL